MALKAFGQLGWGLGVALWIGPVQVAAAEINLKNAPAAPISAEHPALEPAADIPEEILRTEVITAARSPLTGEPLSAAEYAQIQEVLAAPAGDTLVSPEVRYLIFLLQLRRSVRPILPFIQ